MNRQRSIHLGFTLSEKPQMMLNGREAPELNDRKIISTGVWIGGGIVAALVLGLYAAEMTHGPTD